MAALIWDFLFGIFLLDSMISAKVIDLTHTLTESTYVHGGIPSYNRTVYQYGLINQTNQFLDQGAMLIPEHAGTHMDSPSHFVKGGLTLEQLNIEDCIADGVMIDCSMEAGKDREYLVTKQKLLDWESEHGRIPDNAAVVFNFGWSEKYTRPTEYLGSEDLTNFFTMKFPGVGAEAGEWLLKERKIKMIASDTMSPDPMMIGGKPVTDLPIHGTYLVENKLILENVKNTEQLPPRGFRLFAVPYKFDKSSGAPTRTFALTFDELPNSTSPLCASVVILLLSCLSVYVFNN